MWANKRVGMIIGFLLLGLLVLLYLSQVPHIVK